MVQSGGFKTLRSGALAKSAGVSPDTIRHYEKIGVLPRGSRTESGYRLYPESAVEGVLVVRRALRIGFTLAELAEVLKARDAGGAPCQRVYKLAQGKLKGITEDIEALKDGAVSQAGSERLGKPNEPDGSRPEIESSSLAHRSGRWSQCKRKSISEETNMKSVIALFLFCGVLASQDMQSCPIHK